MVHRLDPTVGSFAPKDSKEHNGMASPSVASRISKLESNQQNLRDVIDSLKSLTIGLTLATELRKKEHALPLSDTRIVQEFDEKLDELRKEIFPDDKIDGGKLNGAVAPPKESSLADGPVKTLPPHMRGKDNATNPPEQSVKFFLVNT